jgi:hypothetical protein
MNELRAQVAQAVKAKRMRKANTRTNQKFLKMSRKQLENFLEQERRRKLGASITGFAVSAEESDKEKANRKRERLLKTRPQATKPEESRGGRNRTPHTSTRRWNTPIIYTTTSGCFDSHVSLLLPLVLQLHFSNSP